MCWFTDLIHSKVSGTNNREEDRMLLIAVSLKVQDQSAGRELVLALSHAHTHTRARTRTHTHAHAHTHRHTHTHAHTQTWSLEDTAAEWTNGWLMNSFAAVRFGKEMPQSVCLPPLMHRLCQTSISQSEVKRPEARCSEEILTCLCWLTNTPKQADIYISPSETWCWKR